MFPLRIIGMVGIAAALGGCASAPRQGAALPASPAPPPPAIEVSRQTVLAAADRFYLEGKNAYDAGDQPGARLAFDRALEAILLSGLDLAKDPVLEDNFDRLTEEIYRLERAASDAVLPAPPPPNAAAIDDLATLDAILGEAPDSLAEREMLRGEIVSQATTAPSALSVTINDEVLAFVELLRSGRRSGFAEGLRRSGRYLPMIETIFAEYGLPAELAYLALIESAFKTQALSRSKARGIWQFMRATGKNFGLVQDADVDERSDPEKSTRAAARYLKYLHAMFGDWEMALAAYNCGEGRVQRAIRIHHSRDFWALSARRALPPETRNYVPAVLASILIARNPARFGMDEEREPPMEYDSVTVRQPIDLRLAADLCGTSIAELQFLNPELRRLSTPAKRSGYRLKVPRGSSEVLAASLARLPAGQRLSEDEHKVRRGDTIGELASRYGVSTESILNRNGLKNAKSLRAGKTIVIPFAPPQLATAELSPISDTASEIASENPIAIPAAEPVTPAVSGTSASPGASASTGVSAFDDTASTVLFAAATDSGFLEHRVERGDTLYSIARRYGVSIGEIQSANAIRRARDLRAGTVLRIAVQ